MAVTVIDAGIVVVVDVPEATRVVVKEEGCDIFIESVIFNP